MRIASIGACLLPLFLLLGPVACDRSNHEERADTEGEPASVSLPLLRDADPETFRDNLALLQRVTADPYGYFRFVNIPFAAEVCGRFAEQLPVLPTVNLHGDAHLEQYAVTNVGYGLSDFDDSCAGPAVLDLVRFGTSVVLACRLRDREEWTGRLLERFLTGYERALSEPDVAAPVPTWVERVVRSFPTTREPFLDYVESILEPITEAERVLLDPGFERYVLMMREQNPHLRPAFFDVVSSGRIRIGVGSALDRKYLLRVAGPSDRPGDDVVLEVREVRDLGDISCIRVGEGRGAFRILVGYSRIGNVPFDFIAPLPRGETDPLDEADFWVHSWQAHYRELDVLHDDITPEELAEIVYDVGVQLGNGHTVEIADPHRFALRRMELSLVRRFRAEIVDASIAMADEIEAAWKRFVDEAQRRGLPVAPRLVQGEEG